VLGGVKGTPSSLVSSLEGSSAEGGQSLKKERTSNRGKASLRKREGTQKGQAEEVRGWGWREGRGRFAFL